MTAVLGYAVFSAGLLYGQVDEGAAAGLDSSKLPHLSPAWPRRCNLAQYRHSDLF